MSSKEKRLAAKMLEDYISYHLSPAGCNDTDPTWLKEFATEELIEMHRQYHDWNGDPEEFDGTARPLSDFCYVALMAHKLHTE